MDFRCLNKSLLVLSAFALPAYGIGETDERFFGFLPAEHSKVEIRTRQEQSLPGRDSPEKIPSEKSQQDKTNHETTEPTEPTESLEKAADETKAFPQPDPPTIEEKELVQRLLKKIDAPIYETRKSAEREIIKLGSRLPLILTELAPPTSIEAKAAIARAIHRLDEAKRRLDEKPFMKHKWRLNVWAKKGEKLDLKPSAITFRGDHSFAQTGNTGLNPETWSYNKNKQELMLNINGGYVIYNGKEDADGNYAGMALNIKGKEWHFKLERVGESQSDVNAVEK